MDDTSTRDARSFPDLPEALAWLYDEPAAAPAPQPAGSPAQPGVRPPGPPAAHRPARLEDLEALPTLLPFSAPPADDDPPPAPREQGWVHEALNDHDEAPVDEARDAPADGDEPASFDVAFSPDLEPPLPVDDMGPGEAPSREPDAREPGRDGRDRPAPPVAAPPVDAPPVAAPPAEVSLFEPVVRPVPAAPPTNPEPLPTWHTFGPPAVRETPPAVRETPPAGRETPDAAPPAPSGGAAPPRTGPWLDAVRRGDEGASEFDVTRALEVLGVLTTPGTTWRLRRELAAEVAGDEHALDDGSAVAALVLRGLASAAGVPVPGDAPDRRRLWARCGVLPDLVSTTVLALGVAPAPPVPAAGVEQGAADRWRLAARDGAPVHVTALDLHATGAWTPVHDGAGPSWPGLLVVDGARVLEAVAGRFGARVPAVCTDGPPGPLPLDLVARVHASGTPIRFVTDVDGPGLAAGTLLAERFGATPWWLDAGTYDGAVRADLPPLTGPAPEPAWAPGLGDAMARAGRALPLERVIPELLAALEDELDGSASG